MRPATAAISSPAGVGTSPPLEQGDTQRRLDRAEAAKDGRMVQAEPPRGPGEAARLGDGPDQAEVVP
jgi:hypothetical protein